MFLLLRWNTHDQSGLRRKGFILLTVHSQKHWEQEFKQKRALQVGADAEATEGSCLLAYFFMACSAFFLIEHRTHQPRDGTIHHGLGFPLIITNYQSVIKKMPHKPAYSPHMEAFPLLRLPLRSLQLVSSWHKLVRTLSLSFFCLPFNPA